MHLPPGLSAYIISTLCTNAGPEARRFTCMFFLQGKLFRLTKVNRSILSVYKPISCGRAIFAFPRVVNTKVNKTGPLPYNHTTY